MCVCVCGDMAMHAKTTKENEKVMSITIQKVDFFLYLYVCVSLLLLLLLLEEKSRINIQEEKKKKEKGPCQRVMRKRLCAFFFPPPL